MAITTFEYKVDGANNIHLVGDFNNWNINSNPMDKKNTGEFSTAIELEPGKYRYKYLVDNKWHNDSSSDETLIDEMGNLNSIKLVSA